MSRLRWIPAGISSPRLLILRSQRLGDLAAFFLYSWRIQRQWGAQQARSGKTPSQGGTQPATPAHHVLARKLRLEWVKSKTLHTFAPEQEGAMHTNVAGWSGTLLCLSMASAVGGATGRAPRADTAVECVATLVLRDLQPGHSCTTAKVLDARPCGDHALPRTVACLHVEAGGGAPSASHRTPARIPSCAGGVVSSSSCEMLGFQTSAS